MRRLVLVVGSDGSATSTASTILEGLGLHAADPDAHWVADFHGRLLDTAVVDGYDARPAAWFDVSRVAFVEEVRAEAAQWLEEEFAGADEVVLSDPGLAWFGTVWEPAAIRVGAEVGYVVVLAAPAGGGEDLAGWVNRMLHVERATRGSARCFVRHQDLVEDWTASMMAVGTQLDLEAVRRASAHRINKVNRFLDAAPAVTPGDGPAESSAPPPLREIAAAVGDDLDALVEGEDQGTHASLDATAERYRSYYEECEAVTRSSAAAAKRAARANVARNKQERVEQLNDRVGELKRKLARAEKRNARQRERNAQLRERLNGMQEKVGALRAERKASRTELRDLRQQLAAQPRRLRDRVGSARRRIRGER